MIGQKELLNKITTLIENNKFPSFSILLGSEGSGKNTLVKEIVKKMGAEHYHIDNKISDIREFIELSNSQTGKVVYVLHDIESSSIEAKNSLLKILEEPSKNSHIILLTTSKDRLLNTILSRGVLFEMQPYSKEDFIEHINHKAIKIDLDKHLKVCSNIGELELALSMDVNKLLGLTDKIISNIEGSTISNVLLIPNKLEITDSRNELPLFINSLQYSLNKVAKQSKSIEKLDKILNSSKLLGDLRNQINNKFLNKKFILDEFLIKMWGVFN